jgi:hypothetical protein
LKSGARGSASNQLIEGYCRFECFYQRSDPQREQGALWSVAGESVKEDGILRYPHEHGSSKLPKAAYAGQSVLDQKNTS